MALAGHEWHGMRHDVTQWINECGICQKVKYQRDPGWQDDIDHHLYSLKPLASLSVDTLGPLPEDEDGNKYIVVIVDNFSKFIGLYATKNVASEDYIRAFIQWVGIFGVPEEIRTDGGSQYTSSMAEDLRSLLQFKHLKIVAYHPQANGMVERRNTEVMKHLRALVYERRVKEVWSQYLPLVQRIMNYTVDGSIGTQPAKVVFGDVAVSDLAMDLPSEWAHRSVLEYLVKLREMQAILIKTTQDFLRKNERNRTRDGDVNVQDVPQFTIGQFVLLKYPNRPPNKLAGLYRGPLVITAIDRPDMIKVRDLISNKESVVHTSRLRVFRHPTEMTLEEAIALAAVDLDEFFVESIIRHTGTGKDPKRWNYLVRWLGYEEGDDSWLRWSAVKDLAALEEYARVNGIQLPE
jgi:hypothetical protein